MYARRAVLKGIAGLPMAVVLADPWLAWAAAAGLDAGLANRYLGALFHALAVDAAAAGERGFAALTEAAQTPGGLNEQALRQLSQAGWYDALAETLDGILARIAGPAAGPPRSDAAD